MKILLLISPGYLSADAIIVNSRSMDLRTDIAAAARRINTVILLPIANYHPFILYQYQEVVLKPKHSPTQKNVGLRSDCSPCAVRL